MRLQEKEVVKHVRRLQVRELRAWVQAGLVQPSHGDAGPVFDDMDIARLRLLCDLRKEMGVAENALPMVLSLLDQIHGLRSELRMLSEAVEDQPEPVRRAVLKAYARRAGGD